LAGAIGLDGDPLVRGQWRPEFLEVVETPHLGAEKVDDDIARINENPIALRNTLDAKMAEARRFQLLDELIGDGGNMPVRPAVGYYHLIGKGSFAVQIDGGDLLRLGIVETVENCGQELRGILALGRMILGGSAFSGAAGSSFGFQGFFPLQSAQADISAGRRQLSGPFWL
jgi:hypothetical protein